jgi:2',3'-cyclic-nucleotide 2'-phosphodiesterase (5'-nucleotidase family)
VPRGGLARRATLIQQIRETAPGALLVLDAGNSLMGEELATQSEGRLTIEAMNLMGYDALGVGPLELAKGIEALQQRAAEADFPILSCNLVWSESQVPALEPFAIVEREGLRLGIIGVTHAGALGGLERLSPGVVLLEATEQVARYVAQVRPRADLVIVLSYLGLAEDQALAQAVEGIDLIVGGRSRRILREPLLVEGTIIVQAGFDGELVGRLELGGHLDAAQMVRFENIALGPEIADDPAMVQLVAGYRSALGADE